MKRNTSPLRYAPWLARDVLFGPGLLYLVVLLVIGIVIFRLSSNSDITIGAEGFQAQAFEAVMLVAVLVAAGGMVSTDIHQGFYRAWFSKPMAPWWYYLQRWVLGGVVFLLTPVVLGIILMVLVGGGTGITLDLMLTLGLGYLLIGSAVLLASTLSRFDWLLVFMIVTAQGALTQVRQFAGEDFSRTVEVIYKALPPFHLLNPTNDVLSGRPLIHVLAYGVGMLALALLILVQRPLGSGGRA